MQVNEWKTIFRELNSFKVACSLRDTSIKYWLNISWIGWVKPNFRFKVYVPITYESNTLEKMYLVYHTICGFIQEFNRTFLIYGVAATVPINFDVPFDCVLRVINDRIRLEEMYLNNWRDAMVRYAERQPFLIKEPI